VFTTLLSDTLQESAGIACDQISLALIVNGESVVFKQELADRGERTGAIVPTKTFRTGSGENIHNAIFDNKVTS
jgi:hypothetical protein